MRGQPGFFEVDERLRRLSDLGDQLLGFAAAVDFEIFRPELTRALVYSDGSQGGRPPFDPVTMFKSPGDPGGQHPLRRADRVPDQRPPVVHAVPGAGLVGPGSRRAHDLAVPGEADESRAPSSPCSIGSTRAARGRLHRDGRADRRRHADGRAEAGQHRRGEDRRSRTAAFPRSGSRSPPSFDKRIATHAGR